MALTGGQERACSILLDGTSHSIHQEPWLVSNRYWKPFKFCKQDHILYQETFLQRYISAWDCWPEPLGALTFVIYFCICRPAIQAFQRMNYSTVEPPTLQSRLQEQWLVSSRYWKPFKFYNQDRLHQKIFLYQEPCLFSNRYWNPLKFYNQDSLHQDIFFALVHQSLGLLAGA